MAKHWLDELVLPDSWRDLRGHDVEDAERVDQLTAELQRELAPSHPLKQVTWSLVAASVARDDVLLVLEDARVAITHLTYTSSGPEQPPSPMTTVLTSREELERQFLLRD
jgi:hypothetical protein